jgi:hypothetical protein
MPKHKSALFCDFWRYQSLEKEESRRRNAEIENRQRESR